MIDPVKQLEKKFYKLLSEDSAMQEFLDDEAFAGIWFWDLNHTNIIWLSKSLRKLLGFGSDEFIEFSKSWDGLLSIDDKDRICKSLFKYVESGSKEEYDISIPFLQKNNQTKSLHCKAINVDNKAYLLGLVQISQWKKDIRSDQISEFPFERSTELLNPTLHTPYIISESIETQEYASKYESLIIAGNLGGWEYKADSGELWCSKEYFEILGYDTSGIPRWGKYNTQNVWLDQLHPDDLEKASAYFEIFLKDLKGVYRQDFRMKHADGSWIWISSKGRVII